jgi:hypothetical protein
MILEDLPQNPLIHVTKPFQEQVKGTEDQGMEHSLIYSSGKLGNF